MMHSGKAHIKNIKRAGKDTGEAGKTLIMVHGRGGNAEDMLSLARYLPVEDFALLAPQATNDTWYPYSFLAPPGQNEPWLSSALILLGELVDDLTARGVAENNIWFLGFSQGACLMLEFITRHAAAYGGAAAFSGGLIGDKIYTGNYRGDFHQMPVFIGSSNPDPHVPVERVHATANILKDMHADVTAKIYDHMGHTICQDEIDTAARLVFKATV